MARPSSLARLFGRVPMVQITSVPPANAPSLSTHRPFVDRMRRARATATATPRCCSERSAAAASRGDISGNRRSMSCSSVTLSFVIAHARIEAPDAGQAVDQLARHLHAGETAADDDEVADLAPQLEIGSSSMRASRRSTTLRMCIASPTVFSGIACSAMPGIRSRRARLPNASTSWS